MVITKNGTMDWPELKYSRNQVNKAGEILRDGIKGGMEEGSLRAWVEARKVLSNWRSCHGYPINTFQSTLRDKLDKLGLRKAIVAQRLKRTPSIISKLRRFESMRLARMQDIGGLRTVVSNMGQVQLLRDSYQKSLEGIMFKHDMVAERDYIENPKDSGYRSVHLVFRYRNDRAPSYNGLLLELQIRTWIQHTWATAVETMGTFLKYALKSSEGPEEWLRFFAVAGSVFAHMEKCAPVPGYESFSWRKTIELTVKAAEALGVRDKLQAYSVAANAISKDTRKGRYHLIVLDPIKKEVSIRSYSRDRLDEASEDYTKEEEKITKGEPIDAVLVAAGDIKELKRAYPNYFLDTRGFVRLLDKMREWSQRKG